MVRPSGLRSQFRTGIERNGTPSLTWNAEILLYLLLLFDDSAGSELWSLVILLDDQFKLGNRDLLDKEIVGEEICWCIVADTQSRKVSYFH